MRKQVLNRRLVIGLTGGFGTGKSTVAKIFKGYGARLIDADALVHSLIVPGKPAYNKIIRAFGKDILRTDNVIDRKCLAALVFSDPKKRKLLEMIIHPLVIKAVKDTAARIKKGVIVIDAPLLIETGLHRFVDVLVVVKTKRKTQIERLQSKLDLTRAQITQRIKAQLPLFKKVRIADFIIDNNGTYAKTRKQTAEIRRILWRS